MRAILAAVVLTLFLAAACTAPATNETANATTNGTGTADGAGMPAANGTGDAQLTRCDEPRPEYCTKQYAPVCGAVDNGVRCFAAPCDSTDWKTFGNGCEACANASVYGYRPGECTGDEEAQDPQGPGHPGNGLAPRKFAICGSDNGFNSTGPMQSAGYECVERCPDGFDEYTGQIARICVPRAQEKDIRAWDACTTRKDCGPYSQCAYALRTTRGDEIAWNGTVGENGLPSAALRCVPDEYANYLLQTSGLMSVDENGQMSGAIA